MSLSIVLYTYPQVFFVFFFFFLFFFKVTLVANGSSWARGQIRAAAKAYTTATATLDPSRTCNLRCTLQQLQIFLLLSEAWD